VCTRRAQSSYRSPIDLSESTCESEISPTIAEPLMSGKPDWTVTVREPLACAPTWEIPDPRCHSPGYIRGRADDRRSATRAWGERRAGTAVGPSPRPLKKKNAAGLLRRSSGFATRAVIGTLRPTERRRAIFPLCDFYTNPSNVPTVSFDGAEGSRTPDLCSAIAALSQLSYSPGRCNQRRDGWVEVKVTGLAENGRRSGIRALLHRGQRHI
jgi:hypothetical protein